jgi:hypothetical protein
VQLRRHSLAARHFVRMVGCVTGGSDPYFRCPSCHICTGTGLVRATSAPGVGSPLSRLRRDWAHPCPQAAAARDSAAQPDAPQRWRPAMLQDQRHREYLRATLSTGVPGYAAYSGHSCRNSGIVINGDAMYAINGVHPNPTLTCCYPKSLIRTSLSQATQVFFVACGLGFRA